MSVIFPRLGDLDGKGFSPHEKNLPPFDYYISTFRLFHERG